jgi:Tol biopolymer transport system component
MGLGKRLQTGLAVTIALLACLESPAAAQSIDGTHRLDPSFSADSKRVVFVETVRSGAKFTPTLMTMNVDGSDVKIVASADAEFHNPRFSPDGKSIVFSRFTQGSIEDVWITSFDGKNTRALTQTTGTTEVRPVFTPDGTSVAFVRKPVSDAGGAVVSVLPGSPASGERELFPADLRISDFSTKDGESLLVMCQCDSAGTALVKGASNLMRAFRLFLPDGSVRSVTPRTRGSNDRLLAVRASSNMKRSMYEVREGNRPNSTYVIEDLDASPSGRRFVGAVFSGFDVAPDGTKIIASGFVKPYGIHGLWIYDFAARTWSELKVGPATPY